MSGQNIRNVYDKLTKNNEKTYTKQLSEKKDNDINNNLNNTIFTIINHRLVNKKLSKSKSFLSSSNESFLQFYNNIRDKKNNHTTTKRKKIISLNNNDDKILQLNLFEKLKNSPMFENSEKILRKEKFYLHF